MIIKFLGRSALLLIVAVTLGCNPSTEATSSVENAEQSAIEAYEAALAEEESAMSEAPPEENLEE
ncbi:MAG: hypothetical protein L7U72_14380 [Rubripirellula sp.]|nr:hypothetical protein [Rubripirellula sp.]